MISGEGEICGRGYIVKRILLLAILFATILIGGTGCSMFEKNNNNQPKQDVNELALEYLEQKYGEKFEYCAPAGSSYTGTRTFLATCESFGKKRIVVQIDNYKTDERQFRDNYLALKYEDRLYDYFSEIVNSQFSEFKLYCGAIGVALSADLPADATFDEYLKDPAGNITALAVVKESEYKGKEQLSQILETITSTCGASRLSVVVIVIEDTRFSDCDYEKAHDCNIRKGYLAKGEILRGEGETFIDYYGGE